MGSKSLFYILMIFFTGCGPSKEDWELPIRAKILASENGEYRLREVTYETLFNLNNMEGRIGRLEGGAALSLDADVDEIIKSTNPEQIYRKGGHKVYLDYDIRDGVVIPRNFKSMEMLGLYYAFEKTVLFWEKEMGVSLEDLGTPSIFYNPALESNRDGQKVEVVLSLNAAYLSGVKDFWFFKTSRLEQIPVKMNFGVVAHEFGHFIFDYYFAEFDPGFYESGELISELQLSGINEGLADFFSYVTTQSVTEYAASLEELDQFRRLPVRWTISNLLSSGCTGGFYCKGSILASALYEIANLESNSSIEVAEAVIRALPGFRSDWANHREDEDFDYYYLINRILEQLSPEDKLLYCDIFKSWFDSSFYIERMSCDS